MKNPLRNVLQHICNKFLKGFERKTDYNFNKLMVRRPPYINLKQLILFVIFSSIFDKYRHKYRRFFFVGKRGSPPEDNNPIDKICHMIKARWQSERATTPSWMRTVSTPTECCQRAETATTDRLRIHNDLTLFNSALIPDPPSRCSTSVQRTAHRKNVT
jgi:hypothetical protein